METFISSIEKATGLTFTKSFSGSNSYYCNERRIRISDHFSKYSERMLNTFNDNTALDLAFPNGFDLDFALKMINKDEFFMNLKKGVKIEHVRADIVGDIEFISCDSEKEYVEVLKLNDGRIVKYNFDKINIKYYES